MTRVLIAPQEFKGSLSATQAAAAIAAGISRARPAWELDVLPMSDGGPGFIDALQVALGGEPVSVEAHDALLRPVTAAILWVPGPRLAVVESAMANGLTLIEPGLRDSRAADTFGVGELIAVALQKRPATLLVGVGGSATTDGGHGMARALGATLLDEAGRHLSPGGASLADLARIDWRRSASLEGVEVVVATDVTNALTGPAGAAAVYGPQKGATPADVEALDAALVRYAAVVRRALGVEVDRLPGAGAAGGLAAGLVAFLGARIESGFDIVARVSRLRERLQTADMIVTGEGSFDHQSLQGKTTGRLIELATQAGRPCVVFAGRADDGLGAPNLASIAGGRDPIANAAQLLEELAESWAHSRTGG